MAARQFREEFLIGVIRKVTRNRGEPACSYCMRMQFLLSGVSISPGVDEGVETVLVSGCPFLP